MPGQSMPKLLILRAPLEPRLTTLRKPRHCVGFKAAILVIDMQNDFCHPDGWLAHIGVDITPARTPSVP